MALAGEFVDAADTNALNTYYAIKAGDESVTSSVTFQNDDDLFADLSVGIWRVELDVGVTGATAGDVKTQWTTSGTITCLQRVVIGPSSGMTDANTGAAGRIQAGFGFGTQPAYGTDGSQQSYISERLIVDCDVVGRLQFQWAQNASSGTATIVKTGSSLTWRLLTAG